MNPNKNASAESRKGFLAVLRGSWAMVRGFWRTLAKVWTVLRGRIWPWFRRNPWYYWYTGNRRVAVSAWVVDALIVILVLAVIPVYVLDDAPWRVLLTIMLGFVLQEALIGFLLLLGMFHFVAPGPVKWAMKFLNLLPFWPLVFGAIWGALQSRFLAACMVRVFERRAARSAAPPNETKP